MTTTWKDDYTDAFNTITSLMQGSTSRNNVALTAILMTCFKRLVNYIIAHHSPAPKLNPFDIKAISNGNGRV